MSLATDVAVAAAERVERTAGPAAGLAVWRRLASNAAGPELRGRTILGGIRCAIAVQDLGAIRDLSLLWATVDALDEKLWDGVFAACKQLWRAGLGMAATALAHAEVRRSTTARGLYAYARCLDVSGDPRAAAAFAEAIARSEKEGAIPLGRTCRVRRVAWLARTPDTLSEAIEEAKSVVAADCTPAERLTLARVLLRAPSRFARAGAIALLDELVSTGDAALSRRALVLAARHADDMADELTSLEVDRLVALLSREPLAKEMTRARDTVRSIARLARAKDLAATSGAGTAEAELEAALDEAARLDPELAVLHRRARDILRGRFEPALHETTLSLEASAYPQWTALLDAVVAIRDSAWPRTARALRWLAEASERGERLPPHVWTVAQAALGTEDAEVRAVAGRLVASMSKTTTAAPPRGWLPLARALAGCGMDDLATTLRRSAALAKEPGAAEALGLALTRSGWELARSGERSQAIAQLREARALARLRRVPPPAAAPGGGASTSPPVPPAPSPAKASNPST